jgi:MFS family permease
MPTSPPDPYAALRYPGYRCFMAGRVFYVLAVQMQTVAVSWQIYQRLHASVNQAALALGYIGLVQVIPIVLFALPAGHAADRFNRLTIARATQLLFAICALALLILSHLDAPVWSYYAVLFVAGIGRSYTAPSVTALYTMLVPRELLPNASAWNSSIFQTAATVGPALGGFIVAQAGPHVSYTVNIFCAAIGFGFFVFVKPHHEQPERRATLTLDSLLSGVRFVAKSQLLLAMLCLDLFAVLLGGATALLPIFAHDILHGGAAAYGLLRAAPSVGAIVMALVTTHLKPWRHAGRAMLWTVLGYGLATLVFGLSQWFWLSVAALALTGVFDNISVVIRQTLAQMLTPDEMRGRVASVSFIFISCSNEFGEFESGLTARLLGPVGSVVAGGIGTLLVVAGAAWIFPELKKLGRLHELKPVEIEATTATELAGSTNSS